MTQSAVKALNESRINFYTQEIIERSDIIYRFSLVLVLDKTAAYNLLKKTLMSVVSDIELFISDENVLIKLLTYIWRQHKKLKPTAGAIKFMGLEDLTVDLRALVFLADVLCLTTNQIGDVLDMEKAEIEENLGKARQKLLL